MAKNYTAAEAYKIIRQGINKTAMQEIAEQAPVFAMYAAKGADEIISALPDFITAQKIEKAIKGENIPEPEKASEPLTKPIVEAEVVGEELKQEKEQSTAEEKPKGKRGRPVKAKEEKPDAEEQPKKKRGRPAKVKAPEPVEEVEEEQDEDEPEETEPEQEIEPDEPETEEPAEDDDDDWEI